jgi:hypothetical protein
VRELGVISGTLTDAGGPGDAPGSDIRPINAARSNQAH